MHLESSTPSVLLLLRFTLPARAEEDAVGKTTKLGRIFLSHVPHAPIQINWGTHIHHTDDSSRSQAVNPDTRGRDVMRRGLWWSRAGDLDSVAHWRRGPSAVNCPRSTKVPRTRELETSPEPRQIRTRPPSHPVHSRPRRWGERQPAGAALRDTPTPGTRDRILLLRS